MPHATAHSRTNTYETLVCPVVIKPVLVVDISFQPLKQEEKTHNVHPVEQLMFASMLKDLWDGIGVVISSSTGHQCFV